MDGYVVGLTTENARRCAVKVWAKGTVSSPCDRPKITIRKVTEIVKRN